MPIQITAGVEPEWLCLDEPKQSDSAEFFVQPLTGMTMAQVMAESKLVDGWVHLSESSVPLILQHGVKDWRHVTDDSGAPLRFSQAMMQQLSWDVLYRLANLILQISQLATAEKKTS